MRILKKNNTSNYKYDKCNINTFCGVKPTDTMTKKNCKVTQKRKQSI